MTWTNLLLVVGPPCGGKSTYVTASKSPGDVVIDYDLLAVALGSPVDHDHDDTYHQTVMAARTAVLDLVRSGRCPASRAWIVSSSPTAESTLPHDEVIVVDPGRDEVMRRIARGDRPGRWAQLAEEWYAARGIEAAAERVSRRW